MHGEWNHKKTEMGKLPNPDEVKLYKTEKNKRIVDIIVCKYYD